jgi:hypothetical protein
LHLNSLPQVPKLVRLEFETNLSWHLHMNTNPLLVVHYIWEKLNINFFQNPSHLSVGFCKREDCY